MRVTSCRSVMMALVCAAGLGLGGCVGVESEVQMPPETGDPVSQGMVVEGSEAEDMVVEEAPEDAASGEGLTEGALGNLTYTVEGMDVPLVDGSYQEKPMPDSATFIANYTLGPWQAFGDLNGDGSDDAVVVLIDAPGGSGVFTYLAAVVDEAGTPMNAATVSLGDRPQIESVTINDGLVTVAGKTHGPDDPMCCPSMDFAWVYELVDGELVQEGAEMVDGGAAEAAGEADEVAVERPEVLTVASGAWDGVVCAWAGEGATLAFDGRRASYTCTVEGDSEVVLLDEPVDNGDGSYLIELGTIQRNAADDGFELGETEMVMVTAGE